MRKNLAAGLLAVALALPGMTVIAQADTVPCSEGNALLAQAEPAASTPTQVVNEFYKLYISEMQAGGSENCPEALYKRFLTPDLFRLVEDVKSQPRNFSGYRYFGDDWNGPSIEEAKVIGGETNGEYARVDVVIGRDAGHPDGSEYVRFKAKMFLRLVNGEWRIDNFVYNQDDTCKHYHTNQIYNLRNRLDEEIKAYWQRRRSS